MNIITSIIFLLNMFTLSAFGGHFSNKGALQDCSRLSNYPVPERFCGFESRFSYAHQYIIDNDGAITLPLVGEYFYLTDEILKKYPPQEFIFVGLGASLTFIIAILENLPQVTSIDFPCSLKNEKTYLVFNEESMKYLDNIFSASLTDPRDYVLMDFAFSGESLRQTFEFLKTYLLQKCSSKKVIPFGLRQAVEIFPPKFECASMVMPHKVSLHILHEYAKIYRKYPPVKPNVINQGLVELTVNEKYIKLQNFFKALMTISAKL